MLEKKGLTMKRRIITALLAVSLALGMSASAFAQDEAPPAAPQSQVIATYFHGTARCPTCKKIESYAEEAIKTGFPEELEDGRLVWKSLNMQESENRHFASAYGLYSQSVVLSKTEGGEETGWKNLDQVWRLVGNKPAFMAYIREEAAAMLETETPEEKAE